jgi:hypothetical protein
LESQSTPHKNSVRESVNCHDRHTHILRTVQYTNIAVLTLTATVSDVAYATLIRSSNAVVALFLSVPRMFWMAGWMLEHTALKFDVCSQVCVTRQLIVCTVANSHC